MQQILPRRTTHRHARRQTLQHGYGADRQRPVHAKPARSTLPNRSRETQPRILPLWKLVANLIYDCFFIGVHSLGWI
jgi:hypothetical protein